VLPKFKTRYFAIFGPAAVSSYCPTAEQLQIWTQCSNCRPIMELKKREIFFVKLYMSYHLTSEHQCTAQLFGPHSK